MVEFRKPVQRSENIIDRRFEDFGSLNDRQDVRRADIAAKARNKREEELARLRRLQTMMDQALEDAVRTYRRWHP